MNFYKFLLIFSALKVYNSFGLYLNFIPKQTLLLYKFNCVTDVEYDNSPNQAFIKNENNKICANCIHFNKANMQDSYDHNYDSRSKCKKFGVKNLVSGFVQFELASKCRNSNDMCKPIGLYFIEK
jgi:hypothetical protein